MTKQASPTNRTPTLSLDEVRLVYFLGIGGIGMSAMARWFKGAGKQVSGYDKTPSPLIAQLEAEGIGVEFDEEPDALPELLLAEPEHCLIVYTPAIPKDHKGKVFLEKHKFELYKRSEVLGWLMHQGDCLGVAGTHGKTTTSSMLAHIMYHSGKRMTAFLGGIPSQYGTNLIQKMDGVGSLQIVTEADEYDRSFLTLFPKIAVITSTDADHLDIYGKHESLLESFALYAGQIQKNGCLIVKHGLEVPAKADTHILSYGIEVGQYQARSVTVSGHRMQFQWWEQDQMLATIPLRMPGYHNVENALAAAIAAKVSGVSIATIVEALSSFEGVERRFQYQVEREGCVYIDDYAHHPTEITALLQSVKGLYAGWRIVAAFQPHLFSRTRDFAEGFSQSLAIADEVLLLPIYPARELPISGVSSDMLLAYGLESKALIVPYQTLPTAFLSRKNQQAVPTVYLTIGAGDIDRHVPEIKKLLSA